MSLTQAKPNKQKGAAKTARIPIKIVPQPAMRKPEWIRMKVPDSARFQEIKQILRKNKLHTVCEEASCPNIGECFSGGTATFMILGDLCTRRCPFCDVAHGKPLPPDAGEPTNLAHTIAQMAALVILPIALLRYEKPAPLFLSKLWFPIFVGG